MRFTWEKSATWLPLLDKIRNRRQTAKIIFKAFCEVYREITVFHAARPKDVQQYYREGLRIADHNQLASVARSIFLSGEFPELDEVAFEVAARRPSDMDNLRAFVSLDGRECTEQHGGYLIYGSEHICAIAAGLSRNGRRDYRQVLKRFGRPTIFQFSLPLNQASESDRVQLGQLLRDCIRNVRTGKEPPIVDFTFELKSPLSPEFILGHEHPTLIKDTLLPMQPYYRYAAT